MSQDFMKIRTVSVQSSQSVMLSVFLFEGFPLCRMPLIEPMQDKQLLNKKPKISEHGIVCNFILQVNTAEHSQPRFGRKVDRMDHM